MRTSVVVMPELITSTQSSNIVRCVAAADLSRMQTVYELFFASDWYDSCHADWV